jgi:hypothetical protein
MKLKNKVGTALLGGMISVLLVAQTATLIQARRSNSRFADTSRQLLNEHQLQNVKNFHTVVDFTVTDALARGDMGVFARLDSLQADLPGLAEFSLYDLSGKITDSSAKPLPKRILDPELKARLYSRPELLLLTNDSTLEIYKPLVATKKCLECHDDKQAGAICGATYFRFSNDTAAKLAAQFDQITTTSNLQAQHLLWGVLVMGGLVSAGLTLLIVRPLMRTLTGLIDNLNDGAEQIAAAAGQTSAASQSLAEGAGEQAASLEETSASLEEMSSMTKRNAENAQKANELARQARTAADKGVGDMQTMSAAMEALKVSSDDIAKIIKTIDEIAFQTNILALNAAVEAARAGEAGMGFAVVADEVRNLAQRSAQAAKETAAKIEGAIAKTAQGVEINNKVAATLNEIVTKARQVDELAAEVAGASREQTQGITQINTALTQMDQVTQSNAANAEESAAAAQELNAQATVLKESVHELVRLVGVSHHAAVPQPHPPAPRPARGQPIRRPGKPRLTHCDQDHPASAPQAARGPEEMPAGDGFTRF